MQQPGLISREWQRMGLAEAGEESQSENPTYYMIIFTDFSWAEKKIKMENR